MAFRIIMKDVKALFLFVTLCLALVFGETKAQQPDISGVNNIVGKVNAYNRILPAEKLYLRFDKPYYSTGDTVWFSAFILNNDLNPSALSRKLYVELVNDSNAVVRRFVFPAVLGISYGNIDLDPEKVHEGIYTIRAYTNWIRNFGDNYFFNRSFYINDHGNDTWLIKQKAAFNTNNVRIAMLFKNTDGTPTGQTNLQVKVNSNKAVLLKKEVKTEYDGSIDLNFDIPSSIALKNLCLTLIDKANPYKKAVLPLSINRQQDVDVQFLPEGGHLVNNLPSKVGFKAIGEDGRGVDISGAIYDSDSVEVAEIKTQHNGIGWFNLVPNEGKHYTASIKLPNGDIKTLILPQAKKSGTSLKIVNNFNTDTLFVTAFGSNLPNDVDASYELLGMARNRVCFAATLNLAQGPSKAKIPTALFPTGIVHFILLRSADQQPVNERIAFINHNDFLHISISTDKSAYSTRDSIGLKIKVTDNNYKPIQGCFSVAVTDGHQVKLQPNAENIASRLLLTSDLKGYVEDPGYYIQTNGRSWDALDALLLTQGWVGYDFSNINKKTEVAFQAEKSTNTISGVVTNLLGKAVVNSNVLLLNTGTNHFLRDTITDKLGKFIFTNLPDSDQSVYLLSARRSGGSTVNGGISIDDRNDIPVVKPINIPISPWNVNADSTILNFVKANTQFHKELDKAFLGTTGHMMKDVTIRDHVLVKNSQSLNLADDIDQTLGETAMINAGKSTLLEILEKSVRNFRTGYARDSTNVQTLGSMGHTQLSLYFLLKDKKVHFVFDGVDIDKYYEPSGMPNDHYEYQKQYLDDVTAEDLLGLEVIYTNNGQYNTQNLETDDLISAGSANGLGADYAYIEITTRSGNGPNVHRASGVYVYRPLPLTFPKEYYRPRYPVKDAPHTYADLRSTIFWVPAVITNKSGEATISFYAADLPTQYNVGVEGANLKGLIGTNSSLITIK